MPPSLWCFVIAALETTEGSNIARQRKARDAGEGMPEGDGEGLQRADHGDEQLTSSWRTQEATDILVFTYTEHTAQRKLPVSTLKTK